MSFQSLSACLHHAFYIYIYIYMYIYISILYIIYIILYYIYYDLISKICDNFYLGQAQDLKQRTAKNKSYVKNPHNSTCRICSGHFRDCNQPEPYFQVFPFYYETNTAFREYKEKRYILRWKSPLNLNKT